MTEYLEDRYEVTDPRFVSAYDELPLWSAMFGLVLLEHVELKPNVKVLDVGCGTGFPLLELAQRLGPSCRVYGIDPWSAAVAWVRQKVAYLAIPNVSVIEGDAAAMPFGADEFDLIVSNLGINNFEDPQAALAECRRVAKPSASLVLTTNLRGHMNEFYAVFRATLSELGKEAELSRLQAHVDHRVTVPDATAMLANAGFRVRRVHEERFAMRFLDGSAMLRHRFIRIGFLGAWRGVLSAGEEEGVFRRLEENLNRLAAARGELRLTIPMACIEAEEASAAAGA